MLCIVAVKFVAWNPENYILSHELQSGVHPHVTGAGSDLYFVPLHPLLYFPFASKNYPFLPPSPYSKPIFIIPSTTLTTAITPSHNLPICLVSPFVLMHINSLRTPHTLCLPFSFVFLYFLTLLPSLASVLSKNYPLF